MSEGSLIERARYWIVEDVAAGAEEDEEHLLLIAELCDQIETAKVLVVAMNQDGHEVREFNTRDEAAVFCVHYMIDNEPTGRVRIFEGKQLDLMFGKLTSAAEREQAFERATRQFV